MIGRDDQARKELIDADTLWKLKNLKAIIIGVLYEDEIVYEGTCIEDKPNVVMENVTISGGGRRKGSVRFDGCSQLKRRCQ